LTIQCTLHIVTRTYYHQISKGLLWSWSYGSWIYYYLYNQCLHH
jgi:hypothetical protein